MSDIVDFDRTVALNKLRLHGRLSYDDFLVLYDSAHAEWLDGEVRIMPPVDRKHQRIIITLLTAIGHYAGGHGGEVLTAPFQMRLQELRRGRQPDLIYVGSEQLGQLTTNFLDGPASLVVEVVSAETKVTDTCEKFSEYQIAGVKEYWIIDPDDRKCSFYVLNAAGMYIEQQISANEKYASVVLPGLTIDTRWFWRLRPPGPVEIMNAIALSESEGE